MTDSADRKPAAAKAALSRLSAAERDDLVAYIDGELPPDEEQRIDTVISQNAVARREVARLEKVYDLLDLLERPEVSEDFTASTMLTISQERIDDFAAGGPSSFDVGSLLRRAAFAFALTFGAATLAHFAGGTRGPVNAADLPLLERLDALRAVRDPAFLRWLSTDSVRAQLKETSGE